MEESGNIPRRPVVTHANEPNFRFENGPAFPNQNQFGQKPLNMRVVLTPVRNGPQHHQQQQQPSSNIVRVVAGNPVNAPSQSHPYPNRFIHERPPPRMQENWTNQIILPFPPGSNEIQEEEMASEEITRMRPPPQYPPRLPPTPHSNAQSNQRDQDQSISRPHPQPTIQTRPGPPPTHFLSQEQTPRPTPTLLTNPGQRRRPTLTNQEQRPQPSATVLTRNPEQKPLAPVNVNERRPWSPIPTAISNKVHQRPRPSSAAPANEIQEGPKKVQTIPGNQERPHLPAPAATEGQRPRPAQPQLPTTSFLNPHVQNGIKNQVFHLKPRPNPLSSETGPVSLEFIPTAHHHPNQGPHPSPPRIRPFQPIPMTSQRPIPFQIQSQENGGYFGGTQQQRPFPLASEESRPHSLPHRPQMIPSQQHQHNFNQNPIQSSWEEPEGILQMFKPGGEMNPFNPRPHPHPGQGQQRPPLIRESSEEGQRPFVRHNPNQPHFHPRPQHVLIPMNPHQNFPTIALSSEEILSPPSPTMRRPHQPQRAPLQVRFNFKFPKNVSSSRWKHAGGNILNFQKTF